MITYCKNCDINWARLWTEDVDDETYEFCPKCKSSIDLTDGTDIVSYTKCRITGRTTNVETGEQHPSEITIVKTAKSKKVKVYDESYEEFIERQNKATEDHINDYIRLCDTMSKEEAANKAKYEVVERKFHYEETTII